MIGTSKKMGLTPLPSPPPQPIQYGGGGVKGKGGEEEDGGGGGQSEREGWGKDSRVSGQRTEYTVDPCIWFFG